MRPRRASINTVPSGWSRPAPPVNPTPDRRELIEEHCHGRHRYNQRVRPNPPTEDRIHATARRLYDAECALHIAHQSRVTEWVAAASDRLHDAITEHLAAIAVQHATNQT